MAEHPPVGSHPTRLKPNVPLPGPQPERPYFRGVAAVPTRAPQPDETGAYQSVDLAAGPDGPDWRSSPSRPRDWRRLRAGSGWTWAGTVTALICWGIWLVSLRGGDLVGPALGLLLVLSTAALVFTVSRLLGRAVLESALGRERRSAWPSHLATGLFLVAAGIAFLQQTRWVMDSWRWLADHLFT